MGKSKHKKERNLSTYSKKIERALKWNRFEESKNPKSQNLYIFFFNNKNENQILLTFLRSQRKLKNQLNLDKVKNDFC